MNPFKIFSSSRKSAAPCQSQFDLKSLSISQVEKVLSEIMDPYTQKDWASTKSIKSVVLNEEKLFIKIELGYPLQSQHPLLKQKIKAALNTIIEASKIEIIIDTRIVAHQVQPGVSLLKNVKNTIALASSKGGVGKSTTAINLALALSKEGAQVGILDADIYGPSQSLMLGVAGKRPYSPDNKHITPLKNYNIQLMSMGLLVDLDQPMIWRGPMVNQALQQLCNDTLWDNLDYLIIDLPPGTGDIQLTLSQKIPVTGVVIVTTPQEIALLDVRRGLKMFRKMGIPILGVMENMTAYVCSKCGHTEPFFGIGGADKISEEFDVPVLGRIPLSASICEYADKGKPTVIAEPESEIAQLYANSAHQIAAKLSSQKRDFSHVFPKVVRG